MSSHPHWILSSLLSLWPGLSAACSEVAAPPEAKEFYVGLQDFTTFGQPAAGLEILALSPLPDLDEIPY